MNIAVVAVFGESWKLVEFGSGSVLNHKDAFFAEMLSLQNRCRQFFKTFHVVGRIGKNEIVGDDIVFQKLKDIHFDYFASGHVELRKCFFYESAAHCVGIDTCYSFDSAGDKFIRDVPCSRKQIQHIALIEFDPVVEDVEQTFFRKICCRTYR